VLVHVYSVTLGLGLCINFSFTDNK